MIEKEDFTIQRGGIPVPDGGNKTSDVCGLDRGKNSWALARSRGGAQEVVTAGNGEVVISNNNC